MRRGATMVELLAVLGILALLAALLLPAISAAREASRRLHCSVRLAQLALAAANYESSSGWLVGAGILGKPNHYESPHFKLLPFLGEEERFRTISAAKTFTPPFDMDPATMGEATIPAFQCPSDAIAAGGTNFRFCIGRGFMFDDEQKKTGFDIGDIWGFLSSIRLRRPAELVGGRTRLAFISERLKGDGDDAWIDFKRDTITPVAWAVYAGPGGDESPIVDQCRKAHEAAAAAGWVEHESRDGYAWFFSGIDTTIYHHAMTPNSVVADCGSFGLPYRPWNFGAKTARSSHPGVVNVAFADGHVEPVADQISGRLWAAMSMIRDNVEPF